MIEHKQMVTAEASNDVRAVCGVIFTNTASAVAALSYCLVSSALVENADGLKSDPRAVVLLKKVATLQPDVGQ